MTNLTVPQGDYLPITFMFWYGKCPNVLKEKARKNNTEIIELPW